eukprot:NODE_174_length_14184_cov_0.583671.p6 type:complete len:297 gc:universal NODE_174_length_14184_cov_0.583671:12992-13882(+)
MVHPHHISIIGAGSVGATVAYALILHKVAALIHLIDPQENVVKGQIYDLEDALFLSNTKVIAGQQSDASQSDIIIITAGAKQKPGESRDDLIDRNLSILKSILSSFTPKPDAVIILVSNPVDILTQYAQKLTNLPKNQVIGSGTFLDSMRLRTHLSHSLNIQENAIHAYVLGAHGDHQFVGWTAAKVAGNPINVENKSEIAKAVMRKAYDIIDLKGATYFGIGACVASLCQSILLDQKSIRPISVFHPKYDCVLSWPCVVGCNGAEKVVDIPLNDEEMEKLKICVDSIQKSTSKFE